VAFVAPHVLPWLDPARAAAAGGAERQQVLLARELSRCGVEIAFVSLDSDGRGPRAESRDGAGGGEGAGFPHRIHRTFDERAGLPFARFFHPRLTSTWRALREADADVYYQRCAGMLSEKLGIEAFLVRNAIAPDGEPPLPFGERRHVLFLAALRPWKRPEWFAEIARRIPGVPFVLAGGPGSGSAREAREIDARLRAAAAAAPNLEIAGAVAPARARELHRRALAFVSTSEREGFPNTTLEAWAAGTPVFAASDPDSCVARSGGGAVAERLDDLSRELARALGDRARLAAMGARGRAHLEEHHDPRRSAGDLLAVLERAAASAARSVRPLFRRAEGALR
jgi:glycosyltransferase involved in cell wall biosynthesis